MTSSSQNSLMMAILSLDAYNRGYNAGLDMSSKGNALGDATVYKSSSDFMGQADKAAGFYAMSYTYDGQTVISYRGTDNPSMTANEIAGASDIWQGWSVGAGFAAAAQATLAEQFYKDITTQAVFGGPTPSNLVLTGHSLGGGLAAFIATLTGASATIFDNMPFGAAAVAATISHDVALGLSASGLLSGSPTSGTQYAALPVSAAITQIVTSGEALEGIRAVAPAASLSVFTAALGNPALAAAASTYGELLDTTVNSDTLNSYASFPSNPANLHSQALNVFLLYAQQNNLTDWTSVGSSFYSAYFNNSIGTSVGLKQKTTETGSGTGFGSASSQMMSEIAYTALTTNAPFGTTALQSLFSDEDALGWLVTNKDFSSDAMNVVGISGNTTIKALAEIAVQYAADQATMDTTGEAYLGGALEQPTSSQISVNLDPMKWSATFGQEGAPQIVGLNDLVDASVSIIGDDYIPELAPFSPLGINNVGNYFRSGINQFVQTNIPGVVDLGVSSGSNMALAAGSGPEGADSNAVMIDTSMTSTIAAGNGNDLILGGKNITVGNGNDIILAPGTGNDTISVGTGNDLVIAQGSDNTINIKGGASGVSFIYAGSGNDTINLQSGSSTEGIIYLPMANLTVAGLADLNEAALTSALAADPQFHTFGDGPGQPSPAWGQGGLSWAVILLPQDTAPGVTLELNGQAVVNQFYENHPETDGTNSDSLFLGESSDDNLGEIVVGSQFISGGYTYSPTINNYSPDTTSELSTAYDLNNYLIGYTDSSAGSSGGSSGSGPINLNGANEALTLTDDGASVTASSSGNLVVLNGDDETATIANLGTNDRVNAYGNSDVVTFNGSYGWASLYGNENTITIAGMSNTVNLEGLSYTATATGSLDTIDADGADGTIYLNGMDETAGVAGSGVTVSALFSGATINVMGDGDSVNATGTSDTINVSMSEISGEIHLAQLESSGALIEISGANATVNSDGSGNSLDIWATNSTVVEAGSSNTIFDHSGNQISLSGDGSSLTEASPGATITLLGDDESVTTGSYPENVTSSEAVDTINVSLNDGQSQSVSLQTYEATININGANATVSSGGTDDTINLSASNNGVVEFGTSNTIAVTAQYTWETLYGNSTSLNDTAGDSWITLFGNNESVTSSEAGDTINVSTSNGQAQSVSLQTYAATVNINGTDATVGAGGTDNTINLSSSNNGVVEWGSSNALTDSGTGDWETLYGTNSTITSSGAYSWVTLFGSETATASGANDTLNANGASETLVLNGSNETANVGSAGTTDTVRLLGSSETADLSGANAYLFEAGSSNSITDNGTGDWLDIYGQNTTVTTTTAYNFTNLYNTETATASGDHDTLSASGSNDALTLNGANETANVTGANITTTVAGNNDTINEGGNDNSVSLGGTDNTVIFNAGFGIQLLSGLSAATGDVISLASSEFANFAAVLSGASNSGSNVVLTGANGDTLTLAGISKSALAASEFSFHS